MHWPLDRIWFDTFLSLTTAGFISHWFASGENQNRFHGEAEDFQDDDKDAAVADYNDYGSLEKKLGRPLLIYVYSCKSMKMLLLFNSLLQFLLRAYTG